MHFEDLWNKAESLSNSDNIIDIIKNIIQNCKNLPFLDDAEERQIAFGVLLYNLCMISKLMNINSYASLKLIIDRLDNNN